MTPASAKKRLAVRRALITGAQHGALIVVLDAILLRLFSSLPEGARPEAVGACLATLAMMASGVWLGIRSKHEVVKDHEVLPSAAESWIAAAVAAVVVMVFGVIATLAPGFAAAVLGPSAPAPGGAGHSVALADAIALPALAVVRIGCSLGVRTTRSSLVLAGFGYLALLALLGGAWAIAVRASTDPTIVNRVLIVAAVAAFPLAGFIVAAVGRRLAFVELFLIALGFGYTLYLVASIWAATLLKPTNIPEEQLLVGLSIAPSAISLCLLGAGGSVGFLLFGAGKLDPRFGYELFVSSRYLNLKKRGSPFVWLVLSVISLVADLLRELLILPYTAVAWLVRRAITGKPKKQPDFVNLIGKIAVSGVAIGVLALIVVLSVMSGFEGDLKTKILGAHAHVVLGKQGDDFTEYEEIRDRVKSARGVVSAVPFVLGEGMISSEANLSGTLVKGVDPADFGPESDLRKNIEKGSLDHLTTPEKIVGARPRYLPGLDLGSRSGTAASGARDFGEPKLAMGPGSDTEAKAIADDNQKRVLPGIVIGRELAKSLRVYVGDTVNLVSPVSEEIGPAGPQPKLRRYRVAGIFYSGMFEFDSKFAYIEMKQAQRFFGLRGRATGVEIRVDDVDHTPRIVEELKRRVGGYPYTAKDWREMNKELFSALLLEKLAMFIVLTFIVLVASFNIVSVLVMIVLEKGREIAILKSMGATEPSIMKVFVFQGLSIGIAGVLLGVLGGVGICWVIDTFGIDLNPDVFYINKLPVLMSWGEIGVIAGAALIITYLAAIYPAMAAARLNPVEGLRDE